MINTHPTHLGLSKDAEFEHLLTPQEHQAFADVFAHLNEADKKAVFPRLMIHSTESGDRRRFLVKSVSFHMSQGIILDIEPVNMLPEEEEVSGADHFNAGGSFEDRPGGESDGPEDVAPFGPWMTELAYIAATMSAYSTKDEEEEQAAWQEEEELERQFEQNRRQDTAEHLEDIMKEDWS